MALTAERLSPGVYRVNGKLIQAVSSTAALASYQKQFGAPTATAPKPVAPTTTTPTAAAVPNFLGNTLSTQPPAATTPAPTAATPEASSTPAPSTTPTAVTPFSSGAYTPPVLKSSSIEPFKAPELNPYQIKADNSTNMFQDVFNRATGGTINEYNTAANRLRERTDSATAGNVSNVQQGNLSRGFGNSGINTADKQRAEADGVNAYAQGLASLSDMFEKNRLTGLGIANDSAQGVSDASKWQNSLGQLDFGQIRGLNNDNSQFGYKQNQDNLMFQDKLQTDLLSDREGRTSNEGIASAGNATDLSIAELTQKNANWRASLEGSLSGGSGGGTSSGSTSSDGGSPYTGGVIPPVASVSSGNPLQYDEAGNIVGSQTQSSYAQQRATQQIDLAKKYGISAGTQPPYDPSPNSKWSLWMDGLDNKIAAFESKRNTAGR